MSYYIKGERETSNSKELNRTGSLHIYSEDSKYQGEVLLRLLIVVVAIYTLSLYYPMLRRLFVMSKGLA